jgi:hypothetical protein
MLMICAVGMYLTEGPEKAIRWGVNESQSKFLKEFDLNLKIDPTPLSSNTAKTA